MTGIYIMLGGMVLFATIVGIWDLVAERRNRRGATRPVRQSRIPNP